MTRPRVSGSSKSMMIISPWAKVENRAIAVPSGMTAVAKPIAVMNTERHDIVSVAANATLYPPSGFFDPNDPKNSHTVNIRLGDYNDRGDSSHQEMRKTSLLGLCWPRDRVPMLSSQCMEAPREISSTIL
jgi:hypothetical protein